MTPPLLRSIASSTNTTAYEKLASEVDTAVADGMLSTPVACAKGVELPLSESMYQRGYATTSKRRAHNAPSSTRRRNNHFRLSFPRRLTASASTALSYSTYDNDAFGPAADNFNPDRWIEGDAVRMDKAMIPFGAGPRTCIGKNVSASLLIDFRIHAKVLRRSL